MKGAESPEHERVRKALAAYFETNGWTPVSSPANAVGDMIPDVEGSHHGKRVYGEAKRCEDFPADDTKDQLFRYVKGLPSDYRLYVGVPKTCQGPVQQSLDAWGLGPRVKLVGL